MSDVQALPSPEVPATDLAARRGALAAASAFLVRLEIASRSAYTNSAIMPTVRSFLNP